jgi:hypothetical protein
MERACLAVRMSLTTPALPKPRLFSLVSLPVRCWKRDVCKRTGLATLERWGWSRLTDGDEWIKYITEKLLYYAETPKKVRRQKRAIHRKVREPWQYRWFGMLPFAIGMWLKSLQHKK